MLRIDVSTIVNFDKSEIDVLLYWYDNSLEMGNRRGGSIITLPEEEYLVDKIIKSANKDIKLNEFDIEIIYGWIEKSFFPRMGKELILFPNEESTYRKIQVAGDVILIKKKEQQEYDKQNFADYQRKHSVTSWISAKLKNIYKSREQKLEKERLGLEELDRKIRNVALQLAPIMEERRNKQNRSIDEKIAASNKLKSDLDEIRKKLKF